jgi:hypothetical protein
MGFSGILAVLSGLWLLSLAAVYGLGLYRGRREGRMAEAFIRDKVAPGLRELARRAP